MRAKIALALTSVYIIWGSTYLGIRVAVRTMPPLLMSGVRYLLAGLVMLGALRIFRKRNSEPWNITRTHWKSALIVGAGLLLGGNGLVVVAEKTIPAGIAALVVAMVPMWLAVFDRVIYGQRLGSRAIVGLAVGFAGIITLAAPTSQGGLRFDTLGMIFLVLATISWSFGSLYQRRASLPERPLVGTAMQMISGGGCLLVGGIVTGETTQLDLASISRESWIAFWYLIAFGSLVGFSAYVWLLRNAPTSVVGTYAYVNPVVAVLLAWAILGEAVNARTGLAAAVIVAGVALIVTSASVPEAAETASPADAPAPAGLQSERELAEVDPD